MSTLRTKEAHSFLSRLTTSLLALGISNILFHAWEDGKLYTFSLSVSILAYVAQAMGSAFGAILDYVWHAHIYRTKRHHIATFRELSAFCGVRILFLPFGLLTFVTLYEFVGMSYLESSCAATAAGWLVSYRFFDALLLRRIRSLPRPVARASIKALRHLEKVRSK